MVVAVMVSMVAFLDSTVINLALPATEHDLGGGLALQQWVIDGYLLAMAAAILPGGSISDLFGRVPVMRFGLLAFGAGSALALDFRVVRDPHGGRVCADVLAVPDVEAG